MSIGIKILLKNSDPNGIKNIEISGWTGKALIIPRSKLKDLKNEPDVNSPAIYFLFGDSDESKKYKVYIGETETYFNRLSNHNDNKDFWNTAVVFTGGISRTHVKYLENKSIKLAKEINRYEITNIIEPFKNKLSDFEINEAEDFFDKIKLVLSLFGFNLFDNTLNTSAKNNIYTWKTDCAEAKGTILDTGEFMVFKNSTARFEETPKFKGTSGSGLRKRLEVEGILKQKDKDVYVFTKDYIFNSPSAAADTVAARSTNGWIAWKNKDGKTLDDIERK